MAKWSGDQDAQGFQLKNARNETFAALPAFSDPADRGRSVFISDTESADFGPWIGGESGWTRPGAYGGSAYALTEPGLLGRVEPAELDQFAGWGFSGEMPAFVYTRRPLLVTEKIVLYAQKAAGPQEIGEAVFEDAFADGDQIVNVIWFDLGEDFVSFILPVNQMAHLCVVDSDSGRTVDMMSIMIVPAPM